MTVLRALTREEEAEAVRTATRVILDGGLAAFSTETFYGVGARFDDNDALKRLHEIKSRPHGKPIPLIAGGLDAVLMAASGLNHLEKLIAERFWPGPLTMLLGAMAGLSELISSGGKVALRVPGESFALTLARAVGMPITATSANASGSPPASSAEEVVKYFGSSLDVVVDSGPSGGLLPSTIVDAGGCSIKIMRQGAISEEEITEFLRTMG